MASLILRIVSLFMGRLTLVKRESLNRHRTAHQHQILTQTGWQDQIEIPNRMSPECTGEMRNSRYRTCQSASNIEHVTALNIDQFGR